MDPPTEPLLPEENKTEQQPTDDTSQPDIAEPVPPKPTVAGVEENVNSRFIDYTKATPWEHLISDIERGIKALYQGLNEYFCYCCLRLVISQIALIRSRSKLSMLTASILLT